MEFKFMPQARPNGKTHSERISQSTWNMYRSILEELYLARMSRVAMLNILESEFDFHPSISQLNAQMAKWGYKGRVSHIEGGTTAPYPPSDSDLEETPDGSRPPTPNRSPSNHTTSGDASPTWPPVTPVLVSAVPLEPETSRETSAPTRRPTLLSYAYCSQACCSLLVVCHKHLIAANFLSGLQCRSGASSILLSAIEKVGSVSTIPSSDQVWIKLNFNRLKGGIFAPDSRTSIFSTPDWYNVPPALREYTHTADNTKPTSALAHLALTSQYRKTGNFDFFPPWATTASDSAYECKTLCTEITEWENDTRLLFRLALWCLPRMKMARLHGELQQISVNLAHLERRARLQNYALPRILSCHLLTQWIEEPCPDILSALLSLRGRFGCSMSLEVMLPETFIVLSTMILDRMNITHLTPDMFAQSSWIVEFMNSMYAALEAICTLAPENYCSQVTEKLLSLYSQNMCDPVAETCKYSDQLVLKVAYKIIGKGFFNIYGVERATVDPHLTWMPMADCLKIHSRSSSQISESRSASQPQTLVPAEDLNTPKGTVEKITTAMSLPLADALSKANKARVDDTGALENVTNISVGQVSGEAPRLAPALRRTFAIRLTRMDTNSSGRMSIDSMKALHSRTQASQLASNMGVGRNTSHSSRMTIGSQLSFGRVTGLGRVNSTASKFSFDGENMSIEAVSPALDERLTQGPTDLVDQEAQAELNQKVYDWISREVSQRRRPDFGRRSTEPIFMLDATRPTPEIMLIQV